MAWYNVLGVGRRLKAAGTPVEVNRPPRLLKVKIVVAKPLDSREIEHRLNALKDAFGFLSANLTLSGGSIATETSRAEQIWSTIKAIRDRGIKEVGEIEINNPNHRFLYDCDPTNLKEFCFKFFDELRAQYHQGANLPELVDNAASLAFKDTNGKAEHEMMVFVNLACKVLGLEVEKKK